MGSALRGVAALAFAVAAGHCLGQVTPAVATSETHTLALHANGTVTAWGSDSYGQLGQGRLIHRLSPVQIGGLPKINQISIDKHAVAVDEFGQVWSWGENCFGSLGPREEPVSSKPARVTGATGIVAAYANGCTTLALKSDGTVLGWGAVPGYNYLQYGTAMRPIPGLGNVVQLAVDAGHVLALRGDGTVVAFGYNGLGQLGLGFTSSSEFPTVVPGFTGVAELAVSNSVSLARKSNGEIWRWGSNSPSPDLSPVKLPATAATPIAIALGQFTVYAVQTGGSVVQLSGGTWQPQAGFTGITRVDANGYNVVARSAAGIFARGINTAGQLGQGNTTVNAGVVTVAGFANALMVVAGRNATCMLALKSDGTVWFWGPDTLGQSGDGATSIASSVPLPVSIPATIKAISAFQGYSVALDTGGNVWGWGQNTSGQLGISGVDRSSPALIAGISGVQAVAAGGTFVMYLMGDGTVRVSGDAYVLPFSDANPRAVAGLSGIASIAAGYNGFAIDGTGKLFTFGLNQFGQAGNGTTTPVSTPVQVTGFSAPVTRVSERAATGVVTSDGRAWSWGSVICCIGNGASGSSLVPVQVSGITDAMEIAAGAWGKMVVRQGGEVVAWGIFLPLPSGANANLPRPIPFQGQAVAVGVGLDTAFILGSTGLLWGIGGPNKSFRDAFSSAWATVGDGTYVQRPTPVVVAAPNGAGSLDGNNWFHDLAPASAETIPAAFIPKALAVAKAFGGTEGLGLSSTVKYKTADLGKKVNNFVIGVVPPAFFDQVKSAPAASSRAGLEAKAAKNGGMLVVQLTPAGWTDVNGQLLAYSSGTANAAGGASNILNGINLSLLSGARFCVGYGESAESMLGSQALREVLSYEGAAATVSGVPCVLSGVYVDGPPTSVQSAPVTFKASVVGAAPTGSVQFRDAGLALGSPVTLAAANEAVGVAAYATSSLAVGTHSIGAGYSGDGQNPAASAEVPRLHVVMAPLAQTRVALEAPASSATGEEIALVATVTGNQPTGSIQFKDGAANLGAPAPIVAGVASLRVATLGAGSHSLTATYPGDGQNAAGTSPAVTHLVSAVIATQVQLAGSPNPAAQGATVTLTATVTGASPTGMVTLRDGATVIEGKTLSAGSASFSLPSPASGLHPLAVDYAGDGSNAPATSPTLFLAVLERVRHLLQVGRAGTGNGTVASTTPAGAINCGATCSAPFDAGTAVTLAATPAVGSTFTGWSGACTGTGSCALTMDAAKNVTATFVTSAALGLNPTSLDFGGQSMQTTSAAKTVTVSNSGSLPHSVTAVELSSTQFAQTNNCTSVAAGGSCTVNVTFTPAASTTASVPVNATLTVKTGAGDGTVSLFGTGERTLVTHYYASILRRAPDAGGKAFWTTEAARVQALGVNVNEVWFAMAQAFYFSAEYLALNRDNTGFVTDLYNTFFNRAPDQGGLDYWVGQLTGGMPREVALASFMFSAEFRSFTSAIFGNTTARAEVDAVVDFYRGLLARLPDDGGFAYWVGQFRAAQCSGQAAILAQVEAISSAYTLSAEYAARNRGNVQYVGDLYNAFLRRGGDLAGVLFWINQVATAAQTREQVRVQFRNSPEFQARVQAIIAQGCSG